MDIPQLFILLMNTWVVSTFGLYAQCCYEYSSYMPCDEHMYSNIPRNKVLAHLVYQCADLVDPAK